MVLSRTKTVANNKQTVYKQRAYVTSTYLQSQQYTLTPTHRTKEMTDSSLPPANTDIIKLQKELDLQAAVAGQENPFKDFDWGDHLITWPQVG